MEKIKLKKEIERLAAKANFSLRGDVAILLKRAYSGEKNRKAKKALKWILDNSEIADKENLAICQDTGFPVIFIEAGRDKEISGSLIKIIEAGVVSGYRKNYLRASIVDPLKRGEPAYKGAVTHIDFLSKEKGIKITVFPKGFGSENKSQLKMFNPTASLNEIEEFIVDSVEKAGPESCPPFFIGVGIGGTSDQALLLAKKALLSRVDKSNPDKQLDKMEKRLLRKINSLKIGAMGFGGKNTALAVKIKKAPTHIAGLPVGVNISCHALRSATIVIM